MADPKPPERWFKRVVEAERFAVRVAERAKKAEAALDEAREYLAERLAYFEGVEEHEALSADWTTDYHRGLKAGAIRAITQAMEFLAKHRKAGDCGQEEPDHHGRGDG